MRTVAAFLIQSQQRVADHCRRLLASENLAEPEARKLRALLEATEADLGRLAPREQHAAGARCP
jgi:hypothetical protein